MKAVNEPGYDGSTTMPTASTIKMTASQFLNLGEDPSGVRLELVGGEIAESPRPTLDHSFTLLVLSRILGQHIEDNDLGQLYTDVDTVFGENDVRCPDLVFVAKERLRLLELKAIEVPPDLCVEIVSPSSIQIDREEKFSQYAAAGVPHYRIVDPMRRSAEAYTVRSGTYEPAAKGAGADMVAFPPFANLIINLARLWRPTK